MAKVFLRKYIREIESQIDHGQLDEAIAHSRHIIRKYPKHLDTYRMLGKSYLEARRYNEATDIFHRLLMAVPDDFVAHVGMSIINDVQQNMDAAIWHMERAFEVQPSNSAIQSELQRLYSRRDGVEPHKIRLTRGALSHMYVQGELYPQAISEITGVLEEDAGRQDMQVLLARAYFHAGQKSESAEICSQLIRRYPYCLDANRVLVELLPEGEESEKTQVYRNRVCEMDPYAAFVTGSIFRSEDVPDEAVNLDHLEWDGQSVEMEPEWEGSLGIELAGEEPGKDGQPAWLKSAMSEQASASPLPDEVTPTSADAADIPEFLRDAGWGASDGEAQEGSALPDSQETPALAQAEIPEWVKAMAPEGVNKEPEAPEGETPATDDQGTPDWLDAMQSPGSASETKTTSTPEASLGGEIPDWINEASSPEAPSAVSAEESPSEASSPDWLGSLQEQGGQIEPVAETSSGEGTPDWLDAMGAESGKADAAPDAQVAEETPDWLSPTAAEGGQEIASSEEVGDGDDSGGLDSLQPEGTPQEAAGEAPSGEDQPDWLQQLGAGSAEIPGEQASATLDEGDVPDWLKVDADQPPGATQPETSEETPALDGQLYEGWLDEAESGPAEGAQPAEYDKTDTGSLGTSASEQDQALSWLEGLAAKHGAKDEELLTEPEQRAETEPDWVQKAKTLGGEPALESDQPEAPEQKPDLPVESEEPLTAGEKITEANGVETIDLGISPEEQEEALSWLEGLAAGHGAKPEELLTKPEERLSDEPDWVKQAKAQGAASPEEVESGTEVSEDAAPPLSDDQTDIFMQGLKDLEGPTSLPEQPGEAAPAAEEPGGEDLADWMVDQPETGTQVSAAEVSETDAAKTADVAEWLSDLDAKTGQSEAPSAVEDIPEKPAEELPDWLSGLDEEQQAASADVPAESPEWLTDQGKVEPGKPEPVQPSDWQPADESVGEPATEVEPSSEAPETPKAAEPAQEFPEKPKAEEAAPPVSEESPPAEAAASAAPQPTSEVEAVPRPKRTGEFSETQDPLLIAAQNEFARGNIPGALEGYSKLIKKGNLLDEVIFDLRGTLQRYPVEVTIWQALGDAYMRTNRLQEALDAYTKAEGLLR